MIPLDMFDALPCRVSANVTVTGVRHHTKASEAYVDVELRLADGSTWRGSVPVNYRRTGVDATTRDECVAMIEAARHALEPRAVEAWKAEATAFWDASDKPVTRPIFDALLAKVGRWVCQTCDFPNNPNPARRIQDIKEFGFTLATDTSRMCPKCHQKGTHNLLLPVPRGVGTGYETFDAALRARIIRVLGSFDVYEGRAVRPTSLLPDHKFPEIRWAPGAPGDNDPDMTEDAIRAKFQLLTNQRNEQKREVCRNCFQNGERGQPYGIAFFYSGGPDWPAGVPKRGREAEAGCTGCGWYDLRAWRAALNGRLAGQAGKARAQS